MSYNAKVLADSIPPGGGPRLTTLEVTFPRFILAEVNTHRVLSRNSASSRAIPTEKIIQRVLDDPFIPETFNKRVKGMGVGEAFDSAEQYACYGHWIQARDNAVEQAKWLNEFGVDKSRVNRLLEPFMWHTAIISATEWNNFFALRDHEAAQPEFRITAQLMKKAMAASEPLELEEDEWHLPLVDLGSEFLEAKATGHWDYWADISASRCARVSYNRQHDDEPRENTEARAEKLATSGHLSPFEHPARPFTAEEQQAIDTVQSLVIDSSLPIHPVINSEFCGNFRGWVQKRKLISGEANFAEAAKLQA
jgi:hypothetical protein